MQMTSSGGLCKSFQGVTVSNVVSISLPRREDLEQQRVRIERAKQVKPKSNFQPGLGTRTAQDFADEVGLVLREWGFPGQHRVFFDLETHDLIIDGKARRDNGKGVRAITHSGFQGRASDLLPEASASPSGLRGARLAPDHLPRPPIHSTLGAPSTRRRPRSAPPISRTSSSRISVRLEGLGRSSSSTTPTRLRTARGSHQSSLLQTTRRRGGKDCLRSPRLIPIPHPDPDTPAV